MTLSQLMAKILLILPDAMFDEDEDGQIIIHTDMEEDARGDLRKLAVYIDEYPDNESNCQYHDKG